MPITVELQDMFSYSVLPIVFAVILAVMGGIMGLIAFLSKKKAKKPEKAMPAPVAKPVSGNQVKEKYYAIMDDLETKCRSGKVLNRKAYQELSRIVRHFVYEMTGIKVHHNTLDELKKLNMSTLCVVVEECYAPEFSVDQDGSIYDTMNKARMVIKEWH